MYIYILFEDTSHTCTAVHSDRSEELHPQKRRHKSYKARRCAGLL